MPTNIEKKGKKLHTKIKMQFNPDIAADVGVEAAIMFANIEFWIWHNQLNKKHYYDGRYWTYNSQKAFQEQFPFWSRQNIRTILNKLLKKGYILKGALNDHKYDKTNWFAVCANQPTRWLESTNGCARINQPIPDSKPDIIDINSVRRESPVENLKNKNKKWNDKFFAVFKRITGESPKDEPAHRAKFPRLIRQKYQDITLVADALQWWWDLQSKTTGDYYWRGRITLAKLYHRILRDYADLKNSERNLAELAKIKKRTLKTFVV